MMRLIISIILFVVSKADSQWYVNVYTQNGSYSDIQMVNEQIVYTSGTDSFKVFKSTNSGNSWNLIHYSNTHFLYYALSFVSEMVGYLVGNYGKKTTNGGVNWSNFYPGDDVEFLNELTGYFISMDWSIMRTTKGGQTYWNWWANMIEPRGLDFINVNTGWVVGRPLVATRCYKTTNAGITWFTQNIYTPADREAVSFLDSNYGIAVGSGPFSFTTNGGAYWYYVNLSMGGEYSDVQFVSRDVIYAVGIYGKIIKSTDGGVSWFMQNSGTTAHLSGVSFINENTGFACGNNVILKTTNGGISAVVPISNNIPSEFKLYQNYPNPFNPSTKIRFDVRPPLYPLLSKEGITGLGLNESIDSWRVILKVFDILGREVATLVNEQMKPGTYEVSFDANGLASGVYYYTLVADSYGEAGDFKETRKMVLVR